MDKSEQLKKLNEEYSKICDRMANMKNEKNIQACNRCLDRIDQKIKELI